MSGATRTATSPPRPEDGAAAAPPRAADPAPPDFPAPSPAGLIARIRAYDPDADTATIQAAFDLAAEAHKLQRRDNGEPYVTHPLAVAEILASYRLDVGSIATALLHDVIEDTTVTRDHLARKFGPQIAGLVDGVTKLTRLELQSDRTKQAENFRKLVLALSRDIRVLLVKLADRLHNMRTLSGIPKPERRERIARETMEIYAPLAERIGMDAVKSELQTLAFAELDHDAYELIQARLNFLRGQGADVIEEVREDLIRVCRDAGVAVVEVIGREKSPYSIWEKMQRRNIQFEQLSDIMAFRVVVPTRENCYAALGAVHAAYPVIAGRFKDYISTPKSNGYQSLHTGVTLREPRNQKIEVQFRTPQMHAVAENGVAAHWLYKGPDSAPQPGQDAPRMRWVDDLLEILDNVGTDDLLEYTKLELYQDQVFCFSPKGQLIQLPRGATPVDFAYAVHSQVGDTCVGAKVNGRLLPLRHVLQNGDQVEIMTARGGTPSPQWERFVVTGKARARIRRFVQQQQRDQYRDAGRAALAKAFRQDGLDGSERALEAALKLLKLANLEDLYVTVGNGNLGPRDVVAATYPEMRTAARAPKMMPPMAARAPARGGAAGQSMPISGLVPGMAVHYAGCCHPLPGDGIVGIVTTGKGVTIHTRECATLESFSSTPERFIDVDWEPSAFAPSHGASGNGRKSTSHTGRVSVIADNDPAAMASITNAIAKQDGDVTNLRIVNRQADFMEMLVDVEVRDLHQLVTVIASLRAAKCVHSVERAKG